MLFERIVVEMKKLLTFSLIVLLASPIFVGCKSGSSCFTRNGSRVPSSGSSCALFNRNANVEPVSEGAFVGSDSALASSSPRIVNAYPTNEVVMMNATNAYSQCNPCTPSTCSPCDPCTPNQGSSVSQYPSAVGSYGGM